MNEFLLTPVLGLPPIAYGGIVVLLLAVTTLILGVKRAPIKIHVTFALITVILGLVHGILSIIAFI